MDFPKLPLFFFSYGSKRTFKKKILADSDLLVNLGLTLRREGKHKSSKRERREDEKKEKKSKRRTHIHKQTCRVDSGQADCIEKQYFSVRLRSFSTNLLSWGSLSGKLNICVWELSHSGASQDDQNALRQAFLLLERWGSFERKKGGGGERVGSRVNPILSLSSLLSHSLRASP